MKKIIGIFSLISSIVSFILSMVLFDMETGSYEAPLFYGGDAYTGIQQAAAQSANNTIALAEICRLGFGAICLIAAFAFFILALLLFSTKKQKDSKPVYNPPAQPFGAPGAYSSDPFIPHENINHIPSQNNVPPVYNPPEETNTRDINNPYSFNTL